ncbi:obscurin-like [Melanotaenia boesemani]|uniref:obscurin-like n=1 Tax=Melanotaenia boesemani TaxID=1250792 RepID=UPI001C059881|nr:obscurin-like [Melanotaenia boesemani]
MLGYRTGMLLLSICWAGANGQTLTQSEAVVLRPGMKVFSPKITLYPVWDSDLRASQVTLICTLSGFFPKALRVEWQQNDVHLAHIKPIERMLQSMDGEEKTYSLTTEIQPSQDEWENGSSFTCKAVHKDITFKKATSICHIYGRNSPSIHVEIPSFQTVMKSVSEVKATCSLHTAFDAKITWLMDGRVSPSDKVTTTSNTTHIFSDVTVSSSQWKQMKKVTCRAEHKCFTSAEKTVDVAGPPPQAPQVEIRRSLPELLKGNTAALQCDITQLSSQDIYVTFQANGVDMSEKQYVDLPEAPGHHSVSRSFSVPQRYWTSDTSFTCTVYQGLSSTPFTSNSISKIFVDPSVELLLAPSEESGQQKLLCSGLGFNPQIKWLSESKEISSSTEHISIDSNGYVAVTSKLLVPQTEWKTGKVFTCEVSDCSLRKHFRKNISLCSGCLGAPPSIHVEIPSFQTVMKSVSEVKATCLLHTAFDAKITWLMDGRVSPSDKVTTTSNTTHIFSDVTVSLSQWKQMKKVTCRAEHKCFTSAEKTVDVAGPPPQAPQVEIRRSLPELLKGNTAALQCDITQLSSQDIYVTFQANGVDMSEKQYVDLPEAPGHHSVSRSFSVPQRYWTSDTSFTCTVYQGLSSTPFTSNSISKIFVDPSVELLLAPSEESGQQKLLCSGLGFNPQIKWLSESKEISSSTEHVSMDSNGYVAVTSKLLVPQTEWKTGKVFTCEASDSSLRKHFRKNISLCSGCSSAPPSIHVEIPSFQTVMKSVSEVKATCLLHTAFDAKITWLMDGRVSPSDKVTTTSNTTHIFSDVTVSSSQWKQMKKVTCRAEHKCFTSAEKTVDVAGPPPQAPQVEIRRSLPELLKGNTAALQCDITQLSSQDIYVTFQANGVDMSEKQYVDLPEAPGHHSVSRSFSVPQRYWTSDTSFTCTVYQGLSSTPFTSNSISKIFVDPSVELLLAPSEESGQQKLLCSGLGFNPQIKWLSESKEISSSTEHISIDSNGYVAVTSKLLVPQTEWKTGKVFTCEVSDCSLRKHFRKNISLCSGCLGAPPSIHVEIPSFQTVMKSVSEVKATCLLHTAFDAKITWLMDGRVSPSDKVTTTSNTTHIFSDVTVSLSQWKQMKKVTCRAEHKCFTSAEKTVDVAGPPPQAPQVEIRRSLPELLKGNTAALQCDITQLSSQDIYVTFQANGVDMSEKQYVDLPEAPGHHSVSRSFSVPQRYWTSDTSFTCTVYQGLSSTPFTSNSISKIFVDPSVELLLAPSEESGQQKLLCSGLGFNPQIKWLSESKEISSSTEHVSMDSNGYVAVTSKLLVPQTEWKTGKVFTCEASDSSLRKHFRKNISLCSGCSSAPPSIHVEIPSFQTVMKSVSEVKATCLLHTAFDAKITWLMDGRVSPSDKVTTTSNTTHIISDVTVSPSQWKQMKKVTCRAEHKCFTSAEKTVDVAAPVTVTLSPPSTKVIFTNQDQPDKSPVTVTLSPPSPTVMFTNMQAELKCIVTVQDADYLSKTNISWQINGHDVTDNIITESSAKSKTSTLTRSLSNWENVNKVSCSAVTEDMTPVTQELTIIKAGAEPNVVVHILPEEDIRAEVTLVCLVSSPVLQDYYIAWSEDAVHNNGRYYDGIDSPPQKTKNGYFVTSLYTTTKEKWNQNKRFNCNVWPAGSDHPKSRGVSKASGNSCEC